MEHKQTVLILDFGSQFTQLIARRIRESKVYSEVHAHSFNLGKIKQMKPAGIILSGGPMGIYEEDSPQINNEIFQLGIPVLGICYGLQLISGAFNGKVEPAEQREYGKAHIKIDNESSLLKNIKNDSVVWDTIRK